MHYFEPIAFFLTSFMGVILLCAIIAISALYFGLSFRIRIKRHTDRLLDACETIELTENDEGFASNIEEINEHLNQNSLISTHWQEFCKYLLEPSIDDSAQVFYSIRNSNDFFSLNNLLSDKINLRFYNAMPNLLTGAGILGTFMGLVAGIYLAGDNLANPDQAHEALNNLLGGASLAFLTSIVGLFSSIIFSWREKHLVHEFEKCRRRWINGLDNRLRPITLEQITRDNLKESHKQSLILSGFTEQLAFQLTEALEKTVPKALDEKVAIPLARSLEKLQASVEQMAQNQVRQSEEMLLEVVERFSDTIQGAAGQEMQEFAKAIVTMKEQMEFQVAALGSRQEEFNRQAQESADHLSNIFTENTKTMHNQMQAQLNEVSRQQEVTARQSRQAALHVAEIFHEGAEKLSQRVAESVGEVIDNLNRSVLDVTQRLDRTVTDMAEHLDRSAETFAQTTEGLNQSVNQIAGLMEGSHTLMDDLQKLVADTRVANEAIIKLVQTVVEAGGSIQQMTTETNAAALRVRSAVDSLAGSIQNLKETQVQTARTWNEYNERFAETDRSLADFFLRLNDGMKSFAEMANRFMLDLDQHTGSITGTLAGAVSELEESINELSETMQRHVND